MNPTTSNQTATTGSGFVSSILTWIQHPFSTSGSALNWVLFVGLLIIAVWFWNHILMQINQDI
jgi:hypothetical protein